MAEDEPWYKTFNDVFWAGIFAGLMTLCGLIVRSSLASNCTTVQLCCFKCKREPSVEETTESSPV